MFQEHSFASLTLKQKAWLGIKAARKPKTPHHHFLRSAAETLVHTRSGIATLPIAPPVKAALKKDNRSPEDDALLDFFAPSSIRLFCWHTPNHLSEGPVTFRRPRSCPPHNDSSAVGSQGIVDRHGSKGSAPADLNRLRRAVF